MPNPSSFASRYRALSTQLIACLGLAVLPMAVIPSGLCAAEAAQPKWEQCGWGGGGFFYSAAYHPTRDGVIYMGGDVAGVYKTEDHGLNWKLINSGLVSYGVFSLAVDKSHPKTVYAATEGGLCKSTDEGTKWELLPKTGPKDLHLTGEKGKSVRCVAVDQTNGDILYAASPAGSVYKSTDGGQTWNNVYTPSVEAATPGLARVEFGKVNNAAFGGLWFPLAAPADAKVNGLSFDFQGDGNPPRTCFVLVKGPNGIPYRSKNLADLFSNKDLQTVVLKGEDFTVDPDFAAKNADKAAAAPATPDWATMNRLDLACSGALATQSSVAKFGKFSYVTEAGTPLPAKEIGVDKDVQTYANIHIGPKTPGPIFSVTISPENPSRVIASTRDVGLVLSEDAGATWHELKTPAKASCAAFDPKDPAIIYGSFFEDGVWKSTDKGTTWTNISEGIPTNFAVREVVVNPANSQDVYIIGAQNYWGGGFYFSHDGGTTWTRSAYMTNDIAANPTLDNAKGDKTGLSAPTNLTINPANPQELFMSANWRSCLSLDGGVTWVERDKGADITCVTDIRFSGNRTYVTAMDEGTLMTENNGATWKQLSPLKFMFELSGHNWRVGVNSVKGVDHIIATVSPWDVKYPPRVIVSDDGGTTFQVTTTGLPDYIIRPNTMWGQGHPRALALDPKDPNVAYLGIDGDASPGKMGGGIFKSVDGGHTWNQLPNQPASRRMYYGFQVDPTDSKRLFWGACGAGGGIYRSEDGGESWKNVFPNSQWVFDLHVAADGTVYCPAKDLWRSTDHGNTWTQLTHFDGNRTVLGIEVDPRNPKTIWITQTTWDSSDNGALFKTIDGGTTWEDITGNLPFVKPAILRFNPATEELWAGWVGLYKIKQPLATATTTAAK